MKILILASPRSGSSNLLKALAESHQLTRIHEPFNDDYHFLAKREKIAQTNYDVTNHLNVPENVAIKCLSYFNHWLNDKNNKWSKGITLKEYVKRYYNEEYIGRKHAFFKQYVKCFDKIVLLLRRDVGDQLKSLLIGEAVRGQTGGNLTIWSAPYRDFDPVFDQNAVFVTTFLYDAIKEIERISAETKIPIVYYEDLYTSDKLRLQKTNELFDLGITEAIWKKYMDPKNRSRQKKDSGNLKTNKYSKEEKK